MAERTPFERQVEDELHVMVGPIPRFDAVEIAGTAAAAPRPGLLRWPRARDVVGLAAAALVLVVGVGILASLLPTEPGPVRIEGKGSYATISEAVAAAGADDVILLDPGVYEETVEVSSDIEIRGDPDDPSAVVFNIPNDGPAFRLRDADAVLSGITFLSRASDDGADRRPAIDVTGGSPLLEDLVLTSDAPAEVDFIRLYETAEGTVVRDTRSSGMIRANRGARALIEDNVLLREDPDAPLAGIEASRADTSLRIERNELNHVAAVSGGQAEVTGNRIHGAQPALVVTDAGDGAWAIGGTCGVMAFGPVLLTDNDVFDNGTGICGEAEVHGGEIFGNDVGVWIDAGLGSSTITGNVIRDNAVGVHVGPSAEAVLTEVAFCGNGVDVEADETADVERVGSAECEA